VGDEVLQEFSRRILHGLPRQTDWLARLGGEEFAVVLPLTDLAGAQQVAEKLRSLTDESPIATTAMSCAHLLPRSPVRWDCLQVVPQASSPARPRA
jgi:diguanylate cyclase (GGDEF)-like protein